MRLLILLLPLYNHRKRFPINKRKKNKTEKNDIPKIKLRKKKSLRKNCNFRITICRTYSSNMFNFPDRMLYVWQNGFKASVTVEVP